MRIRKPLFITIGVLASCLFINSAFADIEWSGLYRIEANNFKNLEMDGRNRELNYGLSHLILRPKIIAGDGLTLQAQFHIFNNADFPNSQLGQAFGSGVKGSVPATNTSNDGSNVMSRTQRAETINVSQLYLTYTQEYGQLIVGRVPIQFGLGMSHSAGLGLFDHWYDSDDVVAYKIVMGNLSFMPMIGKQYEGKFNDSDDLTDYMAQLMYENPETDLQMGVFYKERHGGPLSADAGTSSYGGASATQNGKVAIKEVNLFVQKDTEEYRLGVEAGFLNGPTGNKNGTANVSLDAYGIAGEFDYTPKSSKWSAGVRTGFASGDNPNTTNTFEGFIFNRNYNVGMLLFNQPMGREDYFRTNAVRGNVFDANNSIYRPDVDAVSNVVYFSPNVTYAFSDRWKVKNTLVTGWLAQNPLTGGKDPGKSLGYEWDISLSFSPRKGVTWINEAGLFFPGKVWEVGTSQDYNAGFAYGLSTKAAISF